MSRCVTALALLWLMLRPAAAQPAENYSAQVAQLEAERRVLSELHRAARTPKSRQEVLVAARRRLHQALALEVLPRWLGTPWGEGPRAEVPGQPGRALHCGSLIITALEATGLRFVDGEQLSKAPGLRMMEALGEQGIARWSGSRAGLLRRLQAAGAGVYLLGLPQHIAFAVVGDHEISLVHASEAAGAVISEPAANAAALRLRAATIFVARLTAATDPDSRADDLAQRWLHGVALGPR